MKNKYERAYRKAISKKDANPLRKMMLFSTFKDERYKEMAKFVDKYEVRNTWLGESYAFPKVISIIEDIKHLPKLESGKKYVLKSSNGSGGVRIITGEELDSKLIKSFLKKAKYLKNYWKNGELQYSWPKNTIFIEEFIEDANEIKIHVFNEYVIPTVIPNRYHNDDRYAWDGEEMKVRCNYLHGSYEIKEYSENIVSYELIKKAIQEAKKIQRYFNQYVRVDFVVSGNKMYFGEVTFTHNAGFFDFNGDKKMYDKFVTNYEKTNKVKLEKNK